MAWQEPKTDWDINPKNPGSEDFNRIEENIAYAMSLVVPGKQIVKQAILDKGGNVISEVPTFQELADGVNTIVSSAGITDAVSPDVLYGKKFVSQNKLLTGTMPNNGTINQTIATQGGQITIPRGYHSGSGAVKAYFANLTAHNIRDGVNIGGVVGTYSGDLNVEHFYESSSSTSVSKTFSFTPKVIIIMYNRGRRSEIIRYFPWSGNIELGVSSGGDSYVYLTRVSISGRTVTFTVSNNSYWEISAIAFA
ncbi:hypothetical protein [Tissierella praeacuta]|uniref:hypothetical protein n=1 Tax=Tissierella praeacuta TaxID=43131 RepID=UPI0028AD06B6|nr:hypothetical protein [Tissierella praeacuta]